LNVERRRFLQLGGIGAAALLAGCGEDEQNQAVGPISGERGTSSEEKEAGEGAVDVNVLNHQLDLEYTAVAAYTAAARALRGPAAQAARRFRQQEREHAVALAGAIKELGGTANKPRESYDFPRLRDQAQILRFASALENQAIAAYVSGIPRLNEASLRARVASILANEAEHLAVLHQALGDRTVPDAFVTGHAEGEA
jgi:rubrerythrin